VSIIILAVIEMFMYCCYSHFENYQVLFCPFSKKYLIQKIVDTPKVTEKVVEKMPNSMQLIETVSTLANTNIVIK
jgi:hypothetical protein